MMATEEEFSGLLKQLAQEAELTEGLRAENERLQSDMRDSNQLAADNFARAKKTEAEVERLRVDKDVIRSQERNAAYEQDIDELSAENQRLRAALQRIVNEADSDDGLTAWDGGDIAREALNETKTEQAQIVPSGTDRYNQLAADNFARAKKTEAEVERLKEICRDIADTINTDPHLYQEPIDYPHVLRKIEDLAVSGYAPDEDGTRTEQAQIVPSKTDP